MNSSILEVRPAYKTRYPTPEAAVAGWAAGDDFYMPHDGYVNVGDLASLLDDGVRFVNIRQFNFDNPGSPVCEFLAVVDLTK